MLWCIISFLLLSIMVKGLSATNQKNWEYTITGPIFANTSDTNKLDLDVKVMTLGRSSYAISGFFDIKVEVTDDYYVEIKLYRSSSGSSRYQLMPLRIENQTFSSFMNKGYKDYLMDSLSSCSNVPQFTGTWVGPQPPIRLSLEKCIIKTDNLPNFMHPGFYKVVVLITSDNFHSIIIGIVKIETIY